MEAHDADLERFNGKHKYLADKLGLTRARTLAGMQGRLTALHNLIEGKPSRRDGRREAAAKPEDDDDMIALLLESGVVGGREPGSPPSLEAFVRVAKGARDDAGLASARALRSAAVVAGPEGQSGTILRSRVTITGPGQILFEPDNVARAAAWFPLADVAAWTIQPKQLCGTCGRGVGPGGVAVANGVFHPRCCLCIDCAQKFKVLSSADPTSERRCSACSAKMIIRTDPVLAKVAALIDAKKSHGEAEAPAVVKEKRKFFFGTGIVPTTNKKKQVALDKVQERGRQKFKASGSAGKRRAQHYLHARRLAEVEALHLFHAEEEAAAARREEGGGRIEVASSVTPMVNHTLRNEWVRYHTLQRLAREATAARSKGDQDECDRILSQFEALIVQES